MLLPNNASGIGVERVGPGRQAGHSKGRGVAAVGGVPVRAGAGVPLPLGPVVVGGGALVAIVPVVRGWAQLAPALCRVHIAILPNSLMRIYDILVWIRIRGSLPLTNGCGSCYFRH
jgi:hypothetical protein